MIKGVPCVPHDLDLIVSHISIAVTNMGALRQKLDQMGIRSRRNISVPNPKLGEAVNQVDEINILRPYPPQYFLFLVLLLLFVPPGFC